MIGGLIDVVLAVVVLATLWGFVYVILSLVALVKPSYRYKIEQYDGKFVIRRYSYFFVESMFNSEHFNYVSDFHDDNSLTSVILAKRFHSVDEANEYIYELKRYNNEK